MVIDPIKSKIALSIISKGKKEEKPLNQVLASVAPYVDKIFITFTEPKNLLAEAEEIAKHYNAQISYYEKKHSISQKEFDWLKEFFGYDPEVKIGDKLFLFDDARNFNLSQISQEEYPWFIWLDSDDVLLNGGGLREIVEMAQNQNIEAVYFNYIYQAEFDEQGQMKGRIIEHLRERLVRNNGHFKWIAPVHETLIEQVPTSKVDVKGVEVLHASGDQRRNSSLTRNLGNLEFAIYQTKGEDPRHIYYLGKALFDRNQGEDNEKAKHLFLRYLNGDEKGEHQSGWSEERAQCWEYLAEVYRRQGQHNNALKAGLNALTEPCNPSPQIFLTIALTHLIKGNNELALFWVKKAVETPEDKTTLVRNPKDLQMRTLQIIFNASVGLNKVDEAYGAAKRMYDMSPTDPDAQRMIAFATDLKDTRDMTMKIAQIADYLEQHGEQDKIRALLQATPRVAEQTPFYADIHNKFNPPRVWGEDEIAIYCGQGFTNWSPIGLIDPKNMFVGGSEEAVIRLSHSLQKQGFKVTVFADPGTDEGEHDGVMFLPWYKMNKNDEFNIMVGWRQWPPEVKAKKSYYWAHDILNSLDFTKDRLDKITKVIVLSDYHRKTIPNVPDEKVMISSNGI